MRADAHELCICESELWEVSVGGESAYRTHECMGVCGSYAPDP